MTTKKPKLVIDAWPQLIEALDRCKMLGTTPEEVARYLIISGLDERGKAEAAYKRMKAGAFASGYRGPEL